MKRIIHAIDELKMGGAQTHLLTILREMVLKHPEDEQIIFVLFDDSEFKTELSQLDIKVVSLNLRSYFENKQYYKAYKKIKNNLKVHNPHVVETHLTWSRLLVNTAAYHLRIKKRIGFEHGDIYMNSLNMRLANFTSQFMFHKIIVCSDSLKKWVHKTHKIREKKLKVMYNCVDLEKFSPIMNKNLANYLTLNKDLPKYLLVTVGTMGKGVNKRMDISIKAVANLIKFNNDVGLVVCGDGEQREKLEKLAVELDVENKVYFLGNRNDVEKILPHCYAYIHSAPYEPFGIVCIEAMACGLPVVIPNTGGIQSIITNKVEGHIYKSLDYLDMANKIKSLIDLEESEYELYSNQALKKVQEYGVGAYVESLYQLYDK